MTKPIPDSINLVNLDDDEQFEAFVQRIIDSGAEEVRLERMAAVAAGLIDLDGNPTRPGASLPVTELLSVEQ